jgi:hypothetical protein
MRPDGLRAQGAGRNPGAGIELEILRHAAVEHEAFFGIVLVHEFRRIAEAVESLLVERGLGQIGRLR